MTIVYDTIRIRSELPRAADWLLDGIYEVCDIGYQELIDSVTVQETDSASELLEQFFPEEFHSRISELHIAIVAMAIIIERLTNWPEFVSDVLVAIGEDIGYVR
jgi:hypothetical protein